MHSTIRSWALAAILAVGVSSGSAAAGVGDFLRKKADEAKAKLKEAKGKLKDVGKKAGAFAGSLGGLADKMEKKCLRDRSGKVPMTPSATPGAVACRAGLKCRHPPTCERRPGPRIARSPAPRPRAGARAGAPER
jgi:hypothetical protein